MGSRVQAQLYQRPCCGILSSTLQSCLRTDNGALVWLHSFPFLGHLLPTETRFLMRNVPCLGFANSTHPSCFVLEQPSVAGWINASIATGAV